LKRCGQHTTMTITSIALKAHETVTALKADEIENLVFDAGTGVYEIYNPADGKSYVGASYTSIAKRWRQHIKELKKGKHGNKRMQQAWNENEGLFEFRILESVETERECRLAESRWIVRKGLQWGLYNYKHPSSEPEISVEFKAYIIGILQGVSNDSCRPENTHISDGFRNYLIDILSGNLPQVPITVYRHLKPKAKQ
jgi:hypothetical protein